MDNPLEKKSSSADSKWGVGEYTKKKNPEKSPTSMNTNLVDRFPFDHLESVLSVQEIRYKGQPRTKTKKTNNESILNLSNLLFTFINCQIKDSLPVFPEPKHF